MTEDEWLFFTDPERMLEFLGKRASDRKLRLFACACARRVQMEEATSKLIELSERFADCGVGKKEFRAARPRPELWGRWGGFSVARERLNALHAVLESNAGLAARKAIIYAAGFRHLRSVETHGPVYGAHQAEYAVQDELRDLADLVREIFGNPFRGAVCDPSWQNANVLDLARTIYEERAYDRLPVLTDALLDAGCDNADILHHCRRPGEHVRGCWALDLILGKRPPVEPVLSSWTLDWILGKK